MHDNRIPMFQSTRPRGARRQRMSEPPRLPSSFNPRARAGRDSKAVESRSRLDGVSIHAPARGATSSELCRRPWLHVSIHAPARGATSGGAYRCCTCAGFNPRARAGRDSTVSHRLRPCIDVSIHAPARGATLNINHAPDIGHVSIHAPARGATSMEVNSALAS